MQTTTTGLIALTLACASSTGISQQDGQRDEALVRAAALHNRFAIETHQRAARRSEEGGNLVISALSIRTALSMMLPASAGATHAELEAILHGGADRRLTRAIEGQGLAGDPVGLANSLWVQEGARIEPAFLETLQRDFTARLQGLDLRGDPEGSCGRLNAWTAKHTGGLISGSWKPEEIDPRTDLVLLNALHFGASWQKAFNKNYSKQRPFWIGPEQRVAVRMMFLQSEFNYLQDPDLHVVELPYEGERFSMLLFVPRTVDGLAAFEGSLSVARLAEIRGKMKREMVALSMPAFDVQSKSDVGKILTDDGPPRLFQVGRADLSPMTDEPDAFLGGMSHEARIQVAEEGTRAAAVTQGKIYRGPGPAFYPVQANRPFFYAVRENRTGAWLLTGRLAHPDGEALPNAAFAAAVEADSVTPANPPGKPGGPAGAGPVGPIGPGGGGSAPEYRGPQQCIPPHPGR